MSELNIYPKETIDLPSEGKFYPENNPLASGQLDVFYMTAKHEDILTSSNLIAKNLVFDRLYAELIATPNVKLDDMLTGDVNALMVASRILGYGKDYKVRVSCQQCGTTQEATADLTLLENTSPSDSPAEQVGTTFVVELPVSKAKVEFKLMTRADEKYMQAELEGYKKIKDAVAPETTTFLKTIIVSINGVTDKKDIAEFANNMLVRDSHFLRDVYVNTKPDINFEFTFECENSECSNNGTARLPIGVDFFWPDIRV